jgi:hypothetical protein
MDKHHRLPSGKLTSSTKKYIDEWRKISSKLESILGVDVYGFDPDFGVRDKDSGKSFSLPLWAAKRIIENVKKVAP